jgi:SEC-C motif domain protein
MNTELFCPCGSKKPFAKCCGRFLEDGERAKTPEQLMRSRYTAHVLLNTGKRGYGDYLVSSWLMAAELGLTAASFSENRVNWQKLEILDTMQHGDYGEVEFKAWFYPHARLQGGEPDVHHERSRFKRVNGIWFYVEPIQE